MNETILQTPEHTSDTLNRMHTASTQAELLDAMNDVTAQDLYMMLIWLMQQVSIDNGQILTELLIPIQTEIWDLISYIQLQDGKVEILMRANTGKVDEITAEPWDEMRLEDEPEDWTDIETETIDIENLVFTRAPDAQIILNADGSMQVQNNPDMIEDPYLAMDLSIKRAWSAQHHINMANKNTFI